MIRPEPSPASEPRRLLVVSNRLPFHVRRLGERWTAERSSGGLATALAPVLARSGGLWLGWPGEAPHSPEPRRQALLEEWESKHGFVPVDLPRELGRRFYEGYANETLWPLFHQFPSNLVYDPRGYEAYRVANQRFRDAVVARARPGDLIWVHDYHLMLLPELLREALPDASVGFFLHIPFPSSELFRVLPGREELLRGLLGADLLAFHTHGHLQNFRRSLLRVLGLDSRMDRVEHDGRLVRLEALPIGIAPEGFVKPIEKGGAASERLSELRRRFEDQRILLAVDRLDYTKGIPERLRAFRRVLERTPQLRERVVLVQVAVPSRERIPRYAELRREVNQLVSELNGDFGTPAWTPVVYIRRGISRNELSALYAAADVGWVTPLRDGMNLVAKEYVACQRGGEGVLLLSEFAGAAAEMGEALLVNPYDEERTAQAVERALTMALDERRERMAALYRRVVRNNAFAWSERFLNALREASDRRRPRPSSAEPLPLAELAAAYQAARRRLILLDYDGTLVPFANRPVDAAPAAGLLEQLGALAADARNVVALVSGRPRSVLESWLGGIPGLWLCAEHGALVRRPGSSEWRTLRPSVPVEWKQRVIPVLEHFVDRTPGSLLEEKQYALVWHYRMADPEFGEWLANELTVTLDDMLAETELRAVRGNKSVEIRLAWANKGEAAQLLLDAAPADLVLAVGDDRTDEDMFERLPATAWSVRVGDGASRARYRLGSPDEVRGLLAELSEVTA
jgi:trehalose 6-phosphate synthase/phosphatase